MPLRDMQGRVIGTFGVSSDISERKKVDRMKNEFGMTGVESGEAVASSMLTLVRALAKTKPTNRQPEES